MIIILMGVTGSGKTHVGQVLASGLQWPFLDGDDFHPPENVEKMAAGTPLTDADRVPWLEDLANRIGDLVDRGQNGILACSALKRSYREILHCRPEVRIVHLEGSMELIQERLSIRVHRYMPASLLKSQFDALEEPDEAVTVGITEEPDIIAMAIRHKLGI